MTQYLMRFNDDVQLCWEYTFDMSSDKMALDYAAEHARSLKHDLAVFRQEGDGDYSFVGSITVSVQTVAKIHTV